MRPRHLLLPGLLALAACRPDPYAEARGIDTPEAYERALKALPDDPQSDHARTRMAELRFAEARRAHTALAYKRFLEDFPSSEQAPDALKLLEGLRYSAAEQDNTIRGFAEFLRDHPDGAHAPQARVKLEALSFAEVSAHPSSKAMLAFLARFPDSPHRVEAERQADDLTFSEARALGPSGLNGYLQRASDGTHREEARALLLTADAEARAASGDMAGAQATLQRLPGPEAAALAEKLAQQELEDVAAHLDPVSLKAFAEKHPGAQGARALEIAAALGKSPKAAALREQVEQLDPLHWGRPVDELLSTLKAPDPRDRWLAARELGALGMRDAWDPLLEEATDSHFEEVRVRAATALGQLAAVLGPAGTEVEVRKRLESLRKMASGPQLFLKVALLEEVNGQKAEALADYRRSLRGDAFDFLPLRREMRLQAASGSAFAGALAARRLAVEAEELVRNRAQGDGAGDPPLLAARWYCGALHAITEASEALEQVPPAAAKQFPEDLGSFVKRASEAKRLAKARLADAEDLARADRAGFQPCEADDVVPRLAEAEQARLAAVAALLKSADPLAAWPLRRASRRDPSSAVRAAAAQALPQVPAAPVPPTPRSK